MMKTMIVLAMRINVAHIGEKHASNLWMLATKPNDEINSLSMSLPVKRDQRVSLSIVCVRYYTVVHNAIQTTC